MRGRVLILLGLIILGGVAVAAILLLGGDDGGGDATATPDTVVDGDNGGPGPVSSPSDGGGGPPIVGDDDFTYIPLVIAAQNISRGTQINVESLSSSGSPGFIVMWSYVPVDQVNFDPETVIELTASDNPDDLDQELEDLLVGCVARTDIPRGTPIARSQLTRNPLLAATTACPIVSGLARRGSDAALFLEADRVAIAVPLDPTGIGQVAYAFQPGDRLDVIMSFLFIDVDEEFQTRLPNTITIITRLEDGSIGFTDGRVGVEVPSTVFPDGVVIGPSEEQQRPRLVTQRTILNAEVVYPGWFPPNGQIYGATPTLVPLPTVDPAAINTGQGGQVPTSSRPTATEFIPVIMTISVTPQEAVMLTWAIDSQIPITYVLRSASALPPEQGGEINEQTEAVTLEYITGLFDIQDPPKLPISIEPAITDIRRFDLTSLRTFSTLFGDPTTAE